jgi:hypothetical protein
MAPYLSNAQLFFDPRHEDGRHLLRALRRLAVRARATSRPRIPYVSDSRLCGQCHQVYNPDEHLYDATGKDTGRVFPLDTTYEEMGALGVRERRDRRAAVRAVTCRGDGGQLSGSAPARATARSRRATTSSAANDWGPALLKAAFPGTRDANYDYTRATAQANLKQAAKLELRFAADTGYPRAGRSIVAVRVTNLSGHKFPTGYADGRRAWIEVAVVGAGGAVDVQSGHYDDATSELVDDDQLRLYEAVHGRDGQPEDHIALHQQILARHAASRRRLQSPRPTRSRSGRSRSPTARAASVAYDDATFHRRAAGRDRAT